MWEYAELVWEPSTGKNFVPWCNIQGKVGWELCAIVMADMNPETKRVRKLHVLFKRKQLIHAPKHVNLHD